jgi:hypothetical protein
MNNHARYYYPRAETIGVSYQPALYWSLPYFIASEKGWWKALDLEPTVDLRLSVGIPNRKNHNVPLAVIDNRFCRRTNVHSAGAQRLEFVDLIEVNFLSGRVTRRERVSARTNEYEYRDCAQNIYAKQITGGAHHATLLAVVRCAMTLPLPHLRQRKRLTNCATGAPGLIAKRVRSPSAITPRCRQLRQRTAIIQRGLFVRLRIATV